MRSRIKPAVLAYPTANLRPTATAVAVLFLVTGQECNITVFRYFFVCRGITPVKLRPPRGYNCNLFWCEADPDVEQSEALESELVALQLYTFICTTDVLCLQPRGFVYIVLRCATRQYSVTWLQDCRREAAIAGEGNFPTRATPNRRRWSGP